MSYQTSIRSLSIEALETDLQYATKELEQATIERLRAHEAESQWLTEVNSLKSLIDARRKRLAPALEALQPTNEPEADIVFQDLPTQVVEEPISHVNWIMNNVVACGDKGISPPELFQQAITEGRTMHRNYPYIVLRKLVEDGKVAKQAGRYYKK